MYVPSHFEEPRTEALHDLIQARPLAALVTLGASGMDANHVPMLLSREEGPYGTLRGHVARANPMRREALADVEALAIFHGADSYISPSWYPSKQEHGKVVPTWNYAVVHAYGALRFIDDAAWLRNLLQDLTGVHEAAFAHPWAMADAPAEFIDRLLGSIVGIEMVITRITGKWKVSQNQSARNQAGVVSGLRVSGDAPAMQMAELVASRTAQKK